MKVLLVVRFVAIAPIVKARAEAQTVVKLTLEEAREIAVRRHPQINAALLNAMAAEQVPEQLRRLNTLTWCRALRARGPARIPTSPPAV